MSKFLARTWSNNWISDNGFPEDKLEVFTDDFSFKEIGVAFSGGGTRSAACTLGQLKALHDLDIISNIRYISAVSGGGWAATPFSFIKSNQLRQFWGKISEPKDIDLSSCKSVLKGSFQSCITDAPILGKLIAGGAKLRGDESFAYSLGKIFLKPFNLHHPDTSFTFNKQTMKEAQKGMSSGSLSNNEKFVLARENTPFLILGATLLNEDGWATDKKYHVEYTGYYSGVRVFHKDKEFLTQDDYFGGGYITSCAYDCSGPYRFENNSDDSRDAVVKRAPKKITDLTNEKAFSLSDIMASTGAAPQEILENIGLDSLGFPEFNHFPIHVPNNQKSISEEYPHSDGGHLENLGVMPLLARNMSKIVVFINTKKPFKPNNKNVLKSSFNKSLKALFIPISNLFGLSKFKTNIVFQDGKKQLEDIINQFSGAVERDNQSNEYVASSVLTAKSSLITKENKFYGIKSGHEVEITWVYNCRSKEWEDKLGDPELADIIARKKKLIGSQKGLEDFPHYGTFFENIKGVIELTPLQTNLLTNLSYWVTKKALEQEI